MAYRHSNRYQMVLLPKSIENYVGDEDPVRAYDAFIEALDLEGLGIQINPHKVGKLSMPRKQCSNYLCMDILTLTDGRVAVNWNEQFIIIYHSYG